MPSPYSINDTIIEFSELQISSEFNSILIYIQQYNRRHEGTDLFIPEDGKK